jgi:hypothetical protein
MKVTHNQLRRLISKEVQNLLEAEEVTSVEVEEETEEVEDVDLSDPAYDFEAEVWANLEETLINVFTSERFTKHLTLNHMVDAVGEALSSGRDRSKDERGYTEDEVAKAMENWIRAYDKIPQWQKRK